MGRRNGDIDPRIGNDRVGLMVTRGQVEHLGHMALKAQMMIDNARNVLCFGSSEKSGVFDNPLTPEQKRRAQKGVWGDAFSMVFLEDIGATDRASDWSDYVFDRISNHNLPRPTDLYAGSVHEARWYAGAFAEMNGIWSYRRGDFKVYESEDGRRRIHIMDRSQGGAYSSSQVRTLIERRDPAWRKFVSAKLWDFYEWEYPPALRQAIELPPTDPSEWTREIGPHPVGTKGIVQGEEEVLILRADGVWRPRTAAESGKSLGD